MLGECFYVKTPFCGLASDVSSDMCGAAYVDWAIINHLVGDESNSVTQQATRLSFYPNEVLTRQQMAMILDRLIATNYLEIDKEDKQPLFSDEKEISSEAVNAMKSLVSCGILQPDTQGNIHPTEQVTQKEALETVTKMLRSAKNTRPPSNDGAHLRVKFFARDAQDNEIVLISVPFQKGESNYGRGWRCIEDINTYRELASEVNQLIYGNDLSCKLSDSPPLDLAALDDSFFVEHNLIAVNIQSFMDPQFDVSIQKQIIKRHTIWMHLRTRTGSGTTGDATGYLFLITVPKGVTRMGWTWLLP